MRRLAQPNVVTASAIAAALTAAVSIPRMLLWAKRPLPLWYVEATIFLGGFILWAFVFGWHTEYTRRPLFTLKIKPAIFAGATLAGILAALVLHFFLDPSLRITTPEDYPADFAHWVASTLFALAFTELFLLFAPFAWSMRLFRHEQIALWLTVAFNVFLLILKTRASPKPFPHTLFIDLLALRIVMGYFNVWFYLRGGIFLAWWLGFLIEARHLLGIL